VRDVEIAPGRGIVGAKRERRPVERDRARDLARLEARAALVAEKLRLIRDETHRRLERGDRAGKIALAAEREPEIVVRVGKAGIASERGAEGHDRGLELARLEERGAEIVMALEPVGQDGGEAAERSDRGRPVARLERVVAEPVERRGVVGRDGERLPPALERDVLKPARASNPRAEAIGLGRLRRACDRLAADLLGRLRPPAPELCIGTLEECRDIGLRRHGLVHALRRLVHALRPSPQRLGLGR